jgi:hypothetical protein
VQPRNNPELEVDCTVIEMHRREIPVRSSFGEAAWFDFILPVKEDA